MKFHILSSLYYTVSGPSTVLCSVNCAPTGGQNILEESLSTSRPAECSEMAVGLTHNRFNMISIAEAGDFTVEYDATMQATYELIDTQSVTDCSVKALEAEHLPFLFPSRYAPSDRMREQANELFGSIEGKLNQAVAIEDWLSKNIEYTVGSSDESSDAVSTFENRSGVCRDFAHLGIAFCRALTIPARYVTVYSYQLEPQDFHAVFEVFIGGTWFVIDGTRKAPLNGLVRIGTGRDASDAAVATLFGGIQGAGIAVDIQVAADETATFEPITRDDLVRRGQVLFLG